MTPMPTQVHSASERQAVHERPRSATHAGEEIGLTPPAQLTVERCSRHAALAPLRPRGMQRLGRDEHPVREPRAKAELAVRDRVADDLIVGHHRAEPLPGSIHVRRASREGPGR